MIGGEGRCAVSIFSGRRLDPDVFELDVDGIRRGYYTDAYFCNTIKILQALAQETYIFEGRSDLPEQDIAIGNIVVEMQFFTRRMPFSVVAGVDEALAMLQCCTGYFAPDGSFINTYEQLEVEAVPDGTFVHYAGDPQQVEPVLKVRGRYRDFAHLETPILGVLSEATRIATNVYHVVAAARGKDIMFFPARFAHAKLQALHGYAYWIGIQAYNAQHRANARPIVSTDAQAAWWGGTGGGTVAHASIACFLGDAVETMLQFCRLMPASVPRIALVDFHNDSVGDGTRIMASMFERFWNLCASGEKEAAEKYRLYAIRLDTSGSLRDKSVPPLGSTELDCGVNPRLAWTLRQASHRAYEDWELPMEARATAKKWCQDVRIVATGGFNADKIKQFEELAVPVDIYGVGSSLLENSSRTGSNNDYTADVVRVKVENTWYHLSKTGRRAGDNPALRRIQ